MTTYVYETKIRVEVQMADDGEPDADDQPVKWYGPEEQEKAAREYAEQAMPLHETYGEEFVTLDAPPLTLMIPCPLQWINKNRERDKDHEYHTCRRRTGHRAFHECNCGANKKKPLLSKLGRVR